MKSVLVGGLALILGLMVLPVWAQRPGGSMGGQRRTGGQRQAGQQPGQMQQRQRVRASQQQQKQYQVCTQAMQRVRSRIRQMTRLAVAGALDAQEMQAVQEQLRAELQAAEQEQAQLVESLSEEQKAAAQDQLGKIAASQEDLDSFAEALVFELDQETLDKAKVREDLKKLDAVAKQLQKQQRDLGGELRME